MLFALCNFVLLLVDPNQMLTQYRTLFHVSLRHAFYEDKLAKDLVLEPTPRTRQLMRQYDLLAKTDGSTFRLIYGTGAGQSPTLALTQGTIQLRFVLRNNNPFFLNITNLPFFNTYSKRLYFHNVGKTHTAGAEAALSVRSTVGEEDLLPSNDKILVTVPDHEEIQEHPLQASDLGLVDFHIGLEGDASIAPPSADPTVIRQETRYSLSFEARSTRWRYHIVNKSQLIYDRMDVSDGRNSMAFTAGIPRTLNGADHEATPLLSDAVLLLQERQPLKPKLKLSAQNGNGESTELFKPIDLPTPDWKRISAEDPSDTLQVYSDMYVYL